MDNVTVITGNIFTSECQTLVNTVNCDGVMGAGIALEFKLRLPEMFEQYVEHCKQGRIDIGKLWIYKPPLEAREKRWVLNFPTKRHWKNPSKIEYLEAGLGKFVAIYHRRGIESIAFPVLGSSNGGLDEERSLSVMRKNLNKCDIPVEIYRYDKKAADDLYVAFRNKLPADLDDASVREATGLHVNTLRKVREALKREHDINSLSQLASVKGIGLKTVEQCFRYVMDDSEQNPTVSPPPEQTEFSHPEQLQLL